MHRFIFTKNLQSCIFGLGKKDLDSGFILSILLRRKGNLGKSLRPSSLEGKKYQCHFPCEAKTNSFALLHCFYIQVLLTGQKKECKKSFITKKCNKRHKLHLAATIIAQVNAFILKINVPDLQGITSPKNSLFHIQATIIFLF